MTEWVAWPGSARDARALEADRRRAIDTLAPRRVWCATLADGLARAIELSTALQRVGWLDVTSPAGIDAEQQTAHVGPDDIVVLHDGQTARLAEAMRERGAHVVLNLGPASDVRFAAHAYLMTEPERLAAFIPAPRVTAARKLPAGPAGRPLGWSSILAEVVACDRGETVGGTLRPRPAVTAR